MFPAGQQDGRGAAHHEGRAPGACASRGGLKYCCLTPACPRRCACIAWLAGAPACAPETQASLTCGLCPPSPVAPQPSQHSNGWCCTTRTARPLLLHSAALLNTHAAVLCPQQNRWWCATRTTRRRLRRSAPRRSPSEPPVVAWKHVSRWRSWVGLLEQDHLCSPGASPRCLRID